MNVMNKVYDSIRTTFIGYFKHDQFLENILISRCLSLTIDGIQKVQLFYFKCCFVQQDLKIKNFVYSLLFQFFSLEFNRKYKRKCFIYAEIIIYNYRFVCVLLITYMLSIKLIISSAHAKICLKLQSHKFSHNDK